MKYKKQIATGALALSLLVGGSSVVASNQEKTVQSIYQRQNSLVIKNKTSEIGTIINILNNGLTMEVKNIKTNQMYSVDVKTDENTLYTKNGLKSSVSEIKIGQKIVVSGKLDVAANIMMAKKIKIIDQKFKNHA